jgi:hypothetical protein
MEFVLFFMLIPMLIWAAIFTFQIIGSMVGAAVYFFCVLFERRKKKRD